MMFKAQTKWRWGVAAYLALVALGAGAYLVGVLADMRGPEWASLAKLGVVFGFPCCALGGLVKLTQLGKPSVAWRAWMRPGTSWIARGSLILVAFMLVSFIHFVLWVWPSHVLTDAIEARFVLGFIGGLCALALILYSGILLTAARPIAFWSTAVLPVLFFLSALASGTLGIVLLGILTGEEFSWPLTRLMQGGIALLVFQGITLAIYLQSSHRVPEARASVSLVLAGELAGLFWFGVVGVGLVLPIVLGLVGTPVSTAVAAACGILGSFFLRQVVLAGGIHAPLRAGSFEVALPIV